MTRALVLMAALATLAACIATPPIRQSGSSNPSTPGADDTINARDQTLATMLGRAQSERIAGQLQQAEATLETALRIAPNDARLWLELAQVQFAAGEFESAGAIAERAISLSGGNVQIIEAAQRIRTFSALQ